MIDKTDVAAGASGIACGVIRNNYFQPAMRELMEEVTARYDRVIDQAPGSTNPRPVRASPR